MSQHDPLVRVHHMLDNAREAVEMVRERSRTDLDTDGMLNLASPITPGLPYSQLSLQLLVGLRRRGLVPDRGFLLMASGKGRVIAICSGVSWPSRRICLGPSAPGCRTF
jgi:hypothetical protein